MKLKNKGKLSSDEVRKVLSKKINPFEVHINRCKYHVLCRQLKSDRGLPGVSKNKAVMKRKRTLLEEYKMRGKSNQFIDQRIGERNKNMTEYDRIMARFATERMRSFNKRAIFNLSDTKVLTHRGQTLSEIERFEDTRSDDEDEGNRINGALTSKFVKRAHFGGGILTKSNQDRETLIDELINESKKRKAERQRNNEETLEATERLDEEWKTLGMIVTSATNRDVDSQKKDQYDIVMKQLKFEPYGQPCQNLKTEENIAKEEKEQMEHLEKELKQLRGVKKYGCHRSADDLDDGFSNFFIDLTVNNIAVRDQGNETSGEDELISDPNDEIYYECDDHEVNEEDEKEKESKGDLVERSEPKKKRKKCTKNKEFEENNMVYEKFQSEYINSPTNNNTEDSSEVQSSDGECAMDDLTDLMPLINDKCTTLNTFEKAGSLSMTTKIIEKQESPETQVHVELPYVLNIPDNYETFRDLITNRSTKQQHILCERLLKSNHPSLEAGNTKKMLTLARYIIELVSKGDTTWESLQVFVFQFSILKEFNTQECLNMVVDSLSTKLELFARNILPIHGAKFLAWYILVFLRPQGLDMLVPVSKPAMSIACSLLTRTHYIPLGLFCCCLLLQDAKISSVVYPEAISYLSNCIKTTKIAKQTISEKEEKNTRPNVGIRNEEAHDFKLNLRFENSVDDEKVLYCSAILLSDFIKVYRKYPESKIMFEQVKSSVTDLKVETYPQTLIKEITELRTQLKVLSSAHLPSITKSGNKPKALRQYEPSYHTLTVGKSHRGLPTEQQEEQKLLYTYKHEFKGAMRELRRDRVFLANVRLKEKAFSDKQRLKKVKEIFRLASAQQELWSIKKKK